MKDFVNNLEPQPFKNISVRITKFASRPALNTPTLFINHCLKFQVLIYLKLILSKGSITVTSYLKH